MNQQTVVVILTITPKVVPHNIKNNQIPRVESAFTSGQIEYYYHFQKITPFIFVTYVTYSQLFFS